MSLRTRIILPYLALLALSIVGVGIPAGRTATDAIEAERVADLGRLLNLLAQGEETLQFFRSHGWPADFHLALLSAPGRVRADSLSPRAREALEAHLIAQGPPAPGAPRTLVLDGRAYVCQYAPLPKGSGPRPDGIFLLLDRAPLDAAQGQARRRILLGAIGAMGGGALLGLLIAAGIVRPLEQLARRSAALAAGDLSVEAPPGGPREVAHLARAFNGMLRGLRAAQSQLLAHEKLALLQRVASGVAHEIRNPLSTVRMNLQALRARLAAPTPSAVGRDLDTVDRLLREIDRLESIVAGLTTFASPAPHRPVLSSLPRLVADTLALWEPQLHHRGVQARIDLPDDLPLVPLDTQAFQQLLVNLLVNALQALPQGGTVALHGFVEREALVLDFEDSGPGVPQPLRERIFEPFFTTRPTGTGLGLPLCRQIVEAHGGSISCVEPSAGGARFRIRLPLAPASR